MAIPQARCNQCGKMFDVQPKVKRLHNGIEKNFIKCPHCKIVFPAFYTDKEIRKLQSRQKVLARDSTLDMPREARVAEFASNRRLLKEKMDALKAKMTKA